MKRLSLPLRRLLPLGLALLLLAGLAFVLLRSGPLAALPVTAATLSQGPLAPALFGIGTVEARRSYLLAPTSTARLTRLHADVGDRIKAGTLLAELDEADLPQRLAALDAAIARAGSTLAAAQAQQRDAAARQMLAAANARRYAELGAQGFMSPGGVEARQQELGSADAALASAGANAAAAAQERQRLQAERAALLEQRSRLRLLAPADALVVARELEPGSTALAGQTVLRLIDPGSLWIRLRLDQGRSAGLGAGLAASIELRSRPGQALKGRVERVETLGDSITEERIALVVFDHPPADLTVGELCEVSLQLPALPAALQLPSAALRQHQGRSGVWRLDADGRRAEFVPVQTGASSLDGQLQLLNAQDGGLKAGDRVVLHSASALQPQQSLRVVERLDGGRP